MEKGIFIDQIQPGSQVQGVFCIESKRLMETQKGAPYLALRLMDRTGSLEARMWEGEGPEEADARCSEGGFARVHADAQLFRDTLQLRVRAMEPVDSSQVDVSDFLPVAPVDLDACEKDFERQLRTIRRDPLGSFIRAMFRRGGRVMQLFLKAPAAKRMHQAYIGGLLEHTVAVANLAQSIASHYPLLDKELLVAGAIVHDIGKIEEFSFDSPPIDYTDKGRLLGHSAIGVELLDQCAIESGFDPSNEDLMALKHMILSHHGQREFGASVLPMTPEALVLHLIDDIDAKMSFLGELSGEVVTDKPAWSSYQRLFERFFYLRPRAMMEEGQRGVEENRDAGLARGPQAKQPEIF